MATRKSTAAYHVTSAVMLALLASAPASAACLIPASPCYPWAIAASEDETVLLEIIPNNTITGAVYRVCLCPPAKAVSIVFDFKEGTRVLGTVTRSTDSAMCRDYRFETARSSTLKVRRADQDKSLVEGCYMTY